jgi:galactose-1-phosphate uridylyltransferase
MGIREEDAESFLEKINIIIPYLNGHDPDLPLKGGLILELFHIH